MLSTTKTHQAESTDSLNSTVVSKHFNIISIIKFLLILGVVIVHFRLKDDTSVNPTGKAIIDYIENIVSGCVSCFFLISGFLYFKNIKGPFLCNYKHKTCRRIKSLLIPYLIWNTAFLIYLIIKAGILNEWSTLFPYGIKSILTGYVSFEGGMPYAYAFWFIRNLMIFCLISPAVYVIVRRSWTFILYLLLVVTLNVDLYGFTFFVTGSYIGYHFKDRISRFSSIALYIICAAIWIISSYPHIFSAITDYVICDYIFNLSMLMTLLFISKSIKRDCHSKLFETLISSTFFIYAVHQFFVDIVQRTLTRLFDTNGLCGSLCVFSLSFLLLILISLAVWWVLRTVFPKMENLLSGGR